MKPKLIKYPIEKLIMKISYNIKFIALLSLGFILLQSCSKDDPDHIHDHTEITNVTFVIEATDEPTQTIIWEDGAQKIETITLKSNTDYNVAISFTNESDPSNIDNITLEVIDEADAHQVFYEFSEVLVDVTSASNDTVDSSGYAVLLNSVWNASTTGTGIVRAYLIHEPNSKSGSTRDAIGGFNDVSIDIPILVVD